MKIAETARLRLRWFSAGDCAFIHELLNDPAWIRYIGDKRIDTLDDARRYLETGPIAMYVRVGFGLYAVELKQTGATIGMCGLIKRDTLDDVDLGFAFLPQFRGEGYAREAASAAISFGTATLGLRRIVAIVSRDNDRSIRLLEKLGFGYESTLRLQRDADELLLYALATQPT